MAENNITKNETLYHDGSEVTNWISQIKAGETTYDIATHHNITFKEGKDGAETKWNGLTDITVVIPSITDIVQTPIEFAGTVKDGVITWNTGHGENPAVGNLVFITNDCKFAEQACEAGDMAIYDGTKWNIVSGENQVEIVGTAQDNKVTVAVGSSKDVLTVEGKTLALTLDYADLDTHVNVVKGGSATAPIKFNSMTVDKKYVKLSQAAGTEKTIGNSVTLQKASKLKSGVVDFTGLDGIVTNVTFGDFDEGALNTIVLNSDKRTFDVTGGSLTKNDSTDFVSDVKFKNNAKVTFGGANNGDEGAFSLINGISPGNGQSFVTGIDGKNEFTVAGCLQPTDGANATYVKGITGEYVSEFTKGSFSLGEGSDIVIGFGDEADSGDVLSKVEVTPSSEDVLKNATVSNHVLSFTPVSVTNGVTVNRKYKTLKKTGFNYTPSSVKTASFVNGGFTKASDVTYTFDTKAETTYTATSGMYKITTPEFDITKGGYTLSNTGMVANVAANTFAVGLEGGKLPQLSAGSVEYNANVTGSVNTELEYTDQDSFYAVAADAVKITMPGAYEIVDGAEGDGVEVGKSGALATNVATVDLSNFATDVTIA